MLVNCLDSVMKEVMILTQVDHPCIVKYFETYDDKMFLYLVMEYIQGQELYQLLENKPKRRLKEQKAAIYMEQIFMAISHLHA